MKNYTYKVTVVIYEKGKEPEVISSINVNTSMIGAIKDIMKMAERSNIEKVRVIRCIELGI